MDADAFFKSLSPWPESQAEYEKEYGCLDVKGKTVVDLGCDVGSTAYYFLRKGAGRVIMIDNSMYAHHVYLTKVLHSEFAPVFSRCEFHTKFSFQKGDVLKCDCEGGEAMLTKDYLDSFRSWLVAIHEMPLSIQEFERVENMCRAAGGKFQRITPGFEHIYAKV